MRPPRPPTRLRSSAQPHEDGPAYHPAVATLSLASAQCVDIYQYLSTTSPSPPLVATPATSTTDNASNDNRSMNDPTDKASTDASSGRTIAAVPLARIYLAPRSLLIMSSSLYTTHLHGISPTTADILTTTSSGTPKSEKTPTDTPEPASTAATAVVPVANLGMLAPEIQDTVRDQGEYRSSRGTRVSLTFRRVTRVMRGGGLAGKVFGR